MKEQEHFDELSEDEFANAVIVRTVEPDDNDVNSIAITRTEFELCSPEPLRLVVLMHWRARERDGQPCTAEAIWATLTAQGIRGINGDTPVALNEVTEAVGFLVNQGLVPTGGEL